MVFFFLSLIFKTYTLYNKNLLINRLTICVLTVILRISVKSKVITSMKLSLTQPQLSQALTKLNKAVDKNSHPNILIQAGDGEINLTLYSSRSFSTVTVAADVEEDGYIAVPGKLLKDLVKGLVKQPLALEVEGEDLVISVAGNSYKLQGSLDLDQFPGFNRGECRGTVSFPRTCIHRVIANVSKEETKQALTGVNITVNEGGTVVLSATDGHTLSRVNQSVQDSTTLSESVTIPAKAFAALGKKGGEVTVTDYDEYVGVEYDNFFSLQPKFESPFPDLAKALEDKSKYSCLVNRKNIIDACKRIQTFAKQSRNVARLHISDDNITVTLAVDDLGAINEEIPLLEKISLENSPVIIGVNISYMIKLLNSFGEDGEVEIRFTDTVSPLHLYSVVKRQRCLLMPVYLRY